MKFVIIASPRTGSSHLVNMLGAHPQVWCHGNIFKQQARSLPVFLPEGRLDDAEEERLLNLRDTDEEAFLEEAYRLDDGRPHVGFKIFEGQNDAVLKKLIENTSVKKIVLYRDNVLANYSSMRAAQESGQWGAKEDTIAEPTLIDFRRRDFVKFHNGYVAFYKQVIDSLITSKQPFHWMDYTDINDSSSLSALVTFIGGNGNTPICEIDQRKQQVKQNSSNILSRFSKERKVELFLEEYGLLHWAQEGSRRLELLAEN